MIKETQTLQQVKKIGNVGLSKNGGMMGSSMHALPTEPCSMQGEGGAFSKADDCDEKVSLTSTETEDETDYSDSSSTSQQQSRDETSSSSFVAEDIQQKDTVVGADAIRKVGTFRANDDLFDGLGNTNDNQKDKANDLMVPSKVNDVNSATHECPSNPADVETGLDSSRQTYVVQEKDLTRSAYFPTRKKHKPDGQKSLDGSRMTPTTKNSATANDAESSKPSTKPKIMVKSETNSENGKMYITNTCTATFSDSNLNKMETVEQKESNNDIGTCALADRTNSGNKKKESKRSKLLILNKEFSPKKNQKVWNYMSVVKEWLKEDVEMNKNLCSEGLRHGKEKEHCAKNAKRKAIEITNDDITGRFKKCTGVVENVPIRGLSDESEKERCPKSTTQKAVGTASAKADSLVRDCSDNTKTIRSKAARVSFSPKENNEVSKSTKSFNTACFKDFAFTGTVLSTPVTGKSDAVISIPPSIPHSTTDRSQEFSSNFNSSFKRSPKMSDERERWNYYFNQLVTHQKQNGNLIPPRNTSLSRWVLLQRKLKRNNQLNPAYIQQLDSLGFQWNGKAVAPPTSQKTINHRQQLWENHFEEYKKYQEFHGRAPPARTTLSYWAIRQRKLYKKGALSEEQVQKLKLIGLC